MKIQRFTHCITRITPIALLALILTSPGAQAHNNSHPAKKAAEVKKEQKDWGIAGDTKAGLRTVTVTMTDNMRFTPDRIDVRQGETVQIVIKNSGQIIWTFNRAGDFEFACLIAGHYQAGMKGTVKVTAAAGA